MLHEVLTMPARAVLYASPAVFCPEMMPLAAPWHLTPPLGTRAPDRLVCWGCSCSSAGKESACNEGDLGSILGLGSSPGEQKGYPLQFSGLENSMDYGMTESQTRLSYFHFLGDQGPGVRRSEAEPFSKRTCPFSYLVVNRSFILQTPSINHKLGHGEGSCVTPWEDWCWSSNTLATWCEEPALSERPWCWGRLRARGEGGDRGWDVWMTSSTQWIWVWANAGRWWRTGKPGVLQTMGSQRVGHDLVIEQQQHSRSGLVGWQREGWGGLPSEISKGLREREGDWSWVMTKFSSSRNRLHNCICFLELKKEGASLPTWETGVSEVTEYMLKKSGVFFLLFPTILPFLWAHYFREFEFRKSL